MKARGIRHGALAVVAGMAMAGPADAQLVYHGFGRSDQSDATFISITSADMLGMESGIVKSFTCAVAWGVRTEANGLESEMAGGALRPTAPDAEPFAAELQEDLRAVLVGRGGGARTRLAAGLMPPANRGRGVEDAAATLVRRLDGLLEVSGRMDPARPGFIAPSRVSAAVAAYNRYLDASDARFLARPTAEVRAVQAVLARLVSAAIDNHGRPAVRAGGDAGGGLACAPAVASEQAKLPEPRLSAERPFAMCVVQAGGPVRVYGLIDLETDDSLVVVEGERKPLSQAYPPLAMASAARWYSAGGDVTLGRERYVKFGLPREMVPRSVAAFSAFQGVPVFAAPGIARPNAVYLPVGGCDFQEYRRAREVINVRG